MKLYIKQKVFSLTSKFTVKDEAGNDRYLSRASSSPCAAGCISWTRKARR